MALPQNMVSIFRQIGPLSDEFLADLDNGLKHIKLKKKEKWLSRGEVYRKFFFAYTFTVWVASDVKFDIC